MSTTRFLIIFLGGLFVIYIIVNSYITLEYVNNKGPDDVGALDFSYKELTKLIGDRVGKASFKVVEFKKNENNPSGLYKVRFSWNGKEGFLLVDYDSEKPHFISKGIEPK